MSTAIDPGMAIDFGLAGPAAENFELGYEAVVSWARACAPELLEATVGQPDEVGGGQVLVSLHPAAPPLSFHFGSDPRVDAETSLAGPGYHAFVVDQLKRLPEFGLHLTSDHGRSGDPTGYFDSDAFQDIVDASASWLEREAAASLRGGAHSFGLRPRYRYASVSESPVNTMLGRRDRSWLEVVAQDGHLGLEALPWSSQERGAAFHRGRALAQLWCDVRFRAPSSEAELERLESVVDDLEQARKCDATIALPSEAWAEVAGLVGRDIPVSTTPEPRIGYRRSEVEVEAQDGWWLTIPGELAEDEREGAFWAGDPERGVWLAAFRPEEGSPAELVREALPDEHGGELFEEQEAGIYRLARLVPDPDGEGELLHYACAVEGALAAGMFAFTGDEGRRWAFRTLRALCHE